jgi:predicted neutral ceramidase superfamily lipid hydrolase
MKTAVIIKILGGLGIAILGLVIGIASLLVSRSVLCDDIQENTGKRYRIQLKRAKGILNSFLLLEYVRFIKRWLYIFFICEIIFSFICVVAFVIVFFIGVNQTMQIILAASVLIMLFFKVIPLSIPWGKYRN